MVHDGDGNEVQLVSVRDIQNDASRVSPLLLFTE
jgi:hypothetical protein